ncbi:BTB/POZ domain containing protein [Nitzschia inconspicua]|uniref:BTB/POZ domain containing protein n=1 Tax=Nitzschia inconspicua TaxID=303405 RepID=A0A9K3KJB0_9STRA|nr:BTB/POZ domain containing protein [Nitzschia inconspicua]
MSSPCTNNRRHKKIVGTSVTFDCPKVPSGRIETMIFKVNGFADREEEKNTAFSTSTLSAHGRQWKLLIYPRGDARSGGSTEEEHISIFLEFTGSEPITADYTIRCGPMESSSRKRIFTERCTSWGYSDWILRSVFIDQQNGYIDDDGGTTFEISLQLYVDKKSVWYPCMLDEGRIPSQLFKCQASKDVTFEVQGSEFRVHSAALELCAPALFEMVEDKLQTRDGPISVEIPSIEKQIFEQIVQYLYNSLDLESITNDYEVAKNLLVAADRFGFMDLKLYMESTLTEHLLTADTAASLLLFADGHSCALLKEAAMLFYVKDPEAVKNSKDWTLVLESTPLLVELLDIATLGSGNVIVDKSKHLTAEILELLDVTSLRERLDASNLDLDGSRETLVQRLISHVDTTTKNECNKDRNNDSLKKERKDLGRCTVVHIATFSVLLRYEWVVGWQLLGRHCQCM